MRNKESLISSTLYWVFLGLGIHAAYNDKMAVALFFAITCAAESLGISIDYWPKLQEGKSKHIKVKEKVK